MKAFSFFMFIMVSTTIFGQLNLDGVKFYGENNSPAFGEVGPRITIDADGNLYTGATFNNIFEKDGYVHNTKGGYDFVVQKESPDGTVLWSYHFGNTGSAKLYGLTLDSKGNLYLYGTIFGSLDCDPDPVNTKNISSGSMNDKCYLIKLDKEGKFLWASTYGASSWNIWPDGLTFDEGENPVLYGSFLNTISAGSFQLSTPIYLGYGAKFNAANGAVVYLRKYADMNIGGAMKAAINKKTGSIYIFTEFSATIDIDPGPPTKYITAKGKNDMYLSVYDKSGKFVKLIPFKGFNFQELPLKMFIDTEDNIYLLWRKYLNDASTTYETILQKYTKELGALLWSKVFTAEDVYNFELLDPNTIFVNGGYKGSFTYQPSQNTYKITGNGNGFIGKIDSKGKLYHKFDIKTSGVVYPFRLAFHPTKKEFAISGQLLHGAYFDPQNTSIIQSGNSTLKAFTAKYTDLCSAVKQQEKTIACNQYFFKDTLLKASAKYQTFSPDNKGCIIEYNLDLTIDSLSYNTLTDFDSIYLSSPIANTFSLYDCDLKSIVGSAAKNIEPPYSGLFSLIVKNKSCIDTSECYQWPGKEKFGKNDQYFMGKAIAINDNDHFAVSVKDKGQYAIQLYSNKNGNHQFIQSITCEEIGCDSIFDYIEMKGNWLAFSHSSSNRSSPKYLSIYKFNGDKYLHHTDLSSTDIGGSKSFGQKIVINGDFMVISDPLYNSPSGTVNKGAVALFKLIDNEWKFLSLITNSDEVNDGFGTDIAMSGSFIFISAPNRVIGNYKGVITIYKIEPNSNQVTLFNRIINKNGYVFFGTAIAASGSRFYISAFNGVQRYEYINEEWKYKDDKRFYFIGYAFINKLIAVDSNLLVSIGDEAHKKINKIIHCTVNQNLITEKNIYSLDRDSFGYNMAMNPSTIVISSPYEKIIHEDAGRIYFYNIGSAGPTSVIETKDEDFISNLSVYPNPADDYLYIPAGCESCDATIYDFSGKVITTFKGLSADISALPSGLYFLMVNGKGTSHKKGSFIKL